MQIGAVGFSPYIYNANMLSVNSLSKVAPIGQDLVSAKTDFSGLTEDEININPLKKGQTSNFVDILEMQMQTGRLHAAQIMQPEEEFQAIEEMQADNMAEENLYQMRRASEAYMTTA